MEQDTVKLLRECDAGVKTAVNSINEVMDNIKNRDLHRIVTDSLVKHKTIGDSIRSELNCLCESGKSMSTMAKAMTWMKINWKLSESPSDATVAELMYDGCSMGVKSLARYMNQYENASEHSKKYAKKLIEAEDTLMTDLLTFM